MACSAFFDETYCDNAVAIEDIPDYKKIAGRKSMASVHIGKYTRENFSDLTKMNIYKLHKLSKNIWGTITYGDYMELSKVANILDCQLQKVSTERKVDVLNTALYIVLDYFGNRDSFYDSVVIGSERGTEQVPQPV